MLDFKEETHEYFLKGKRIPSVSELMKPLVEEVYTSNIPEFIMEQARNRGSEVHALTEIYDLHGIYDSQHKYYDYLKHYIDLKNKLKFEVVQVEQKIHAESYAGTLDRIILYKGKTWLIDLKATSEIHKSLLQVQLAFYNHIAKCENCGVIHLTKKKAEMVKIEPRYDIAEILLRLYYEEETFSDLVQLKKYKEEQI